MNPDRALQNHGGQDQLGDSIHDLTCAEVVQAPTALLAHLNYTLWTPLPAGRRAYMHAEDWQKLEGVRARCKKTRKGRRRDYRSP